jgi:hypothetical protein
MDFPEIVWDKVFATRFWAFINLALPALIIPIAAVPYWLRKRAIPWMRIVREGQLCFYAVVILAASGYEIMMHWAQPYVAGMTYLTVLLGFWAVLIFGFIFADGDGTKDLPRQFDDARVVQASLPTAGLSVIVAWATHALVEGVLK